MNIIEVGTEAPDFTLTDNKDRSIRLSGFRGKKVYSLEQLPDINEVLNFLSNSKK